MRIDELEAGEQRVLGGLTRLMLRSDGDFSEEEEVAINRIGEAQGDERALWKLISDSAQAYPSDAQIREAVGVVERAQARALILATLSTIAEADGVDGAETELLQWLRGQWKA